MSGSFVCLRCGESKINELGVCIVSHPVKRWNELREPIAYANPLVDWQSDYPYSIVGGGGSRIVFECDNCSAQFEHPKRAAGESA